MREIVGADAVIAARRESISGVRVLGRYRLQIRLTKPLGDFTARLTMPFFCPILPATPIDPAGSTTRPARGRTTSPSGSSTGGSCSSATASTGAAGRRTSTRSSGRSARRRGLPARDRAGSDRLLRASSDPCGAYRGLAERTASTAPTGSSSSAVSRARGTSPSTTTGRRSGAGPDPAQEGDQLRDRPAGARPHLRLPRRQARPTRCCRPRSGGRRASIRSAAPTRRARAAVARQSEAQADQARPLRATTRRPSLGQVLEFNLKQIGIDLEVKYFDGRRHSRRRRRGRAVRRRLCAWAPTTPTRRRSSSRCSTARPRATQPRRSTTATNARIDAANRLHGRGAAQGLGRPRRRPDAQRPALGAVLHTSRCFVSRSFGCFLRHPVYGVDIAAVCKK